MPDFLTSIDQFSRGLSNGDGVPVEHLPNIKKSPEQRTYDASDCFSLFTDSKFGRIGALTNFGPRGLQILNLTSSFLKLRLYLVQIGDGRRLTPLPRSSQTQDKIERFAFNT